MEHQRPCSFVVLNLVCMLVNAGATIAFPPLLYGTMATATASCRVGEGKRSVTFRSLVQGAVSGGQETTPSLTLVRTNAQQTQLAARLNTTDAPILAAVDLATGVVLTVFAGLQPSSGYRIEVLAVEVKGNVLEVTVSRSAPAPEDLVRHGFESPYHVVQVVGDLFTDASVTQYQLRDEHGIILYEVPLESEEQR